MTQPTDVAPSNRGVPLFGRVAGGAVAGPLIAFATGEATRELMIPLAVGGAIAGSVLHVTRRWQQRSLWWRMLRWSIAGAVAGAAVGASGLFAERVSVSTIAGGALVGAAALGLFRLELEPRTFGSTPKSRWRTVLGWTLLVAFLGGMVAFAYLAGTAASVDS